jgi:hypothetical protein
MANEDTGQVVFRDWNLVADGTRVTQEFASFKKNQFKPNDCNAIASFYGVSGKKQHQYKDFLSDFKIWNQNHTRMVIFPENIGKRLSIDETSCLMVNSILF